MTHMRRTRLFVVCAVILLAALYSGSVRAEDTWDVSVYKGWTVSDVVVEGLEEEMTVELEDGLALALKTGFLGTKRPLFFPQTLEDDLSRARLFLARRGYPNARVGVRFDAEADAQKLTVIFEIEMGAPVLVGSVSVAGIPVDLQEKANEVTVAAPGAVFADKTIQTTVESLLLLLFKNGYAHADVKSRVETVDSTSVDVFFAAAPGPVVYFGNVVVQGVDADLVPVAEKSISAKDGKRYEPKLLSESQKNLQVLGVFRQVRFDFEEVAPDTLEVIANLTMREPHRIEAGVRYWSEEKLDGGVRWTHRNLFKRARGGAATAAASSVRQRIDFTAWWPAIIVARSRLSALIGAKRETEESYTQRDIGGDLTLSYNFSLRSRVLLGLILSNVDVIEKSDEVITDLEQDGFLAAWSFTIEEDRSNDPIVPTRGTYTRVRAEWGPKYGITDYHYWKIEPAFSAYMGVPRTQETVLAVRLTVGGAEPTGESTELLPSKKFYSGGAVSMRGFKRRKLGPLDSEGAPLGGEALFETSAELRYPLFWRFRGTTFVDAGQVWPTFDDVTVDNVEVAVGQGLWVNTLIGPLRVDLAYRLTYHETTQPRWVFHFSIGPAF